MSDYEQPGFTAPWYTGTSINPHQMATAPGSDASSLQREGPPARMVTGSAPISVLYASSQVPANRPVFDVHGADVNVPGQVPEDEPFTRVTNTYTASFPGAGTPDSHVSTPPHPNSLGVGPTP
jgi:hypothetical protein